MSFEKDPIVKAYLSGYELGIPHNTTELDTYKGMARHLQLELQKTQESLALMQALTEVNAANWGVQLSKDEYYFLCILVGHLTPNNGITGSLLDKFSLDLEANDYDRLSFLVNVVNNQADVQMKLNEFNLENK